MIWPSQSLQENTQYIVALRDLKNHGGRCVQPADSFIALRFVVTSPTQNLALSSTVIKIAIIIAVNNRHRTIVLSYLRSILSSCKNNLHSLYLQTFHVHNYFIGTD